MFANCQLNQNLSFYFCKCVIGYLYYIYSICICGNVYIIEDAKTWWHRLANSCLLGNFGLQLLQNRIVRSLLLSNFRSIFHFLCHFLLDCQGGCRCYCCRPITANRLTVVLNRLWLDSLTERIPQDRSMITL